MSNKIKMNGVPVYSDGIEVRELGNEIIIISEDGKVMHTITDTGRFIWKLIDGEKTVSSILEKICEEYDVKKDLAKSDLFRFLNILIAKKILSSLQ